ncbi:MAG: hypothetical protein AB1480_18220 [Nitrospirota bacterium]
MTRKTAFLSLLILFLFFPLVLPVTLSAWAEETETKTEQNPFTLEIADNQINLKAENVSFKKILSDLEKKAGIKVKIFDGVGDKKVTLNISALPVYAIHDLLVFFYLTIPEFL